MSSAADVRRYYHSIESQLGYRLVVHGVKHFGLHADPNQPMPLYKAQIRENDIIARAFQASPGMKVLEVGCGEGGAANHIAKTYGVEATGIDLLPHNIRRARRAAKKLGLANKFQVSDYMHLPFADNNFNAVYAMETLVHAPNAHKLFTELLRVLKPGSRLVFCEYSMTPRHKMSDRGAAIMTRMNTLSSMPALEEFTTGAFPRILAKSGFSAVTVIDKTAEFLPTLEYFWRLGKRPMKLISKLGLENHFVNAYSALNTYDAYLQGEQLVRYNLVTATKAN